MQEGRANFSAMQCAFMRLRSLIVSLNWSTIYSRKGSERRVGVLELDAGHAGGNGAFKVLVYLLVGWLT
jgi:hypothetical protein